MTEFLWMCLMATGSPSTMRNPAYTVPNPPLPSTWPIRYVFVNVSLSINASGWPHDVDASDAPARAPDDADGAPDTAVIAPVIDTEISDETHKKNEFLEFSDMFHGLHLTISLISDSFTCYVFNIKETRSFNHLLVMAWKISIHLSLSFHFHQQSIYTIVQCMLKIPNSESINDIRI